MAVSAEGSRSGKARELSAFSPADVRRLLAVVRHVERQPALPLGVVHARKMSQFCSDGISESRC
jgi:hypothetical protein